jgi:hypothetical protein
LHHDRNYDKKGLFAQIAKNNEVPNHFDICLHMCNEIYPSKGEHVHANADAAMKVAIVLKLEIEIVLEIEEKSLRRRETYHETGWCATKNGKQLISLRFG